MTRKNLESLDELQRGDVITNKLSGNTFAVTGREGGFVRAVHEVVITNPHDWMLVDQKPEGVEYEPD